MGHWRRGKGLAVRVDSVCRGREEEDATPVGCRWAGTDSRGAPATASLSSFTTPKPQPVLADL